MSAGPTAREREPAEGGILAEVGRDARPSASTQAPVRTEEPRAPFGNRPGERVSPDPLRATDRYRLVTPHAFRL